MSTFQDPSPKRSRTPSPTLSPRKRAKLRDTSKEMDSELFRSNLDISSVVNSSLDFIEPNGAQKFTIEALKKKICCKDILDITLFNSIIKNLTEEEGQPSHHSCLSSKSYSNLMDIFSFNKEEKDTILAFSSYFSDFSSEENYKNLSISSDKITKIYEFIEARVSKVNFERDINLEMFDLSELCEDFCYDNNLELNYSDIYCNIIMKSIRKIFNIVQKNNELNKEECNYYIDKIRKIFSFFVISELKYNYELNIGDDNIALLQKIMKKYCDNGYVLFVDKSCLICTPGINKDNKKYISFYYITKDIVDSLLENYSNLNAVYYQKIFSKIIYENMKNILIFTGNNVIHSKNSGFVFKIFEDIFNVTKEIQEISEKNGIDPQVVVAFYKNLFNRNFTSELKEEFNQIFHLSRSQW